MSLSLVHNLLGFQATFPPPLKLKPLKRKVQTYNIGVPKIIWRTWKDTSWQTKCSSGVLYTQKTMSKWQQRVFADPQCEQFIFSVFENYPEILEAWEKCNIGVMKADLWRYLILYWYGGLYLDVKCPVLQEIKFPKPTTPQTCPRLWTSPWQYKEGVKPYHHHLFPQGEMQQFWIAAEPESPALWNVICQVVANIFKVSEDAPNIPSFLRLAQVDSTKSRILACTGPIVYTFALAVSLQQNDKSVVIVPGNCAGAISYMPPNFQEFPQLLDDHYSKQTKPLTK